MRRNRLIVLFQGIVFLAFWICGLPTLQSTALAQTTSPVQVEKPVKAKRAVPAPIKNASTGDIQSAKADGKVWVNTESGVYHKSGKWFGATKQGKFMTEQDAMKAGYRAAKNEK